jgi:small subunit ribosomal protein S4
MPRDRGPVEKQQRREGVDLELKGERADAGKGALERRPYPPGQHGARWRRISKYAEQLRQKQRAKRFYGLRERQFERVFERARKRQGVAGEQLLVLLELRLDNVLTRLGLAATRRQARQMVSHGHVVVNERRVDRPGYEVEPGDLVAIRSGSAVEPTARRATQRLAHAPPWLLADPDALSGRVVRVPERSDIQTPIETQPIVEFYSR